MKATGMPQVSQKHINPEFIVSKKRAGIHHLIIPVFARNFNSDKSIYMYISKISQLQI